ncbi:MAG: polysaccharide deacetylase family protein [Alphaproteobacteria bacterium]|nr:polysaccharide deacetylase [Rhodospirillaceae bacterium]MDP6019995.1 polysaccharide deacetylase family protein [Alphaproteobacteria bacterium]MDP6257156.1 polysaccharide deacetylase family protein [Alphaproteobacteria bacterium]MDP7055401.1 polysaccharide deacetylase family protein [Alphaproteobacteria bacterium]MDP7228636.1 polysaccharide deacetylase family protein [Alphaproteobacteria bacterium]
MTREPGLYDYSPMLDRPKITWPNGARVAFWVAPNIEFYELDPPQNPGRRPWPKPHPDVVPHSHRDYGNRAGFWRMMGVMEEYGVRGSVSLNVAMCQHHPEIIEACSALDWEFFSHGVYNTRYTYTMTEAQERAMMEDVIKTIKDCTGQDTDGWLAPALSYTTNTFELLAEYGIKYTCDLFHDDQPQPVKTKSGRLISVPYSLEMNDTVVLSMMGKSSRHYTEILKANFDQLYEEGAENGQVMCIPLHPFLIGQPHRIGNFAEVLEYITGHDKVWVTTGREIAAHYYEHHYDDVVAALAANRGNQA